MQEFRITKENSHPILSLEEKKEYARRAMNGDVAARNALIESYVGFVRTIAIGYAISFFRYGVELEDLESSGFIGLIKAIDRLKSDVPKIINGYVGDLITGEILKYVRENFSKLHFTPKTRELILYSIPKVKEKFIASNGREPNIDELAIILGKSEQQVMEALTVSNIIIGSIDYIMTNKGNTASLLAEIVENPFNPSEDEVVYSIDLNNFMKTIGTEKRRKIFELYFQEGYHQKEIAKMFHCTQAEVSRCVVAELDRAKEYFKKS